MRIFAGFSCKANINMVKWIQKVICMKPGLVSVSFRALTPEEIIALCARSGLRGVEWGGDVHVPCGDLDTARRVGDLTRDIGLEVACYGSYCRLTDEEARTGALDKTLETAVALGAPLIRVWAGPRGSAEASEAQRAEVAGNARKLADMAARAGLDIAFEYHGRTLTDDADSALRLLKAVDRKNAGCLWQPPVDMPAGDCLRAIETVSPYIRNVHVFSWAGVDRLPLAAGEEKWRALLPRLERLPGERWLLLEFVRDDDPEQLLADAATLHGWLGGIDR